MDSQVFDLINVTKRRFDKRTNSLVAVLEGVSAQVRRGSLVTLIGPSGAGKSTLLSLLNRLEDPDEGQIFFLGKRLPEWDVLELRRRVGLVFQQPVMLAGTVEDNLLYGPRLRKRETEIDPALLIAQVGLPKEILKRSSLELSGGEQQRVALARTLANNPDVLLLDEVTSSLDPESVRIIEQLILDLNAKGLTCLWVTHDLEQAKRLDGEVWIIIGGRLIEASPARDVFSWKCLPLTCAFLNGALAERGVRVE